MSLLQREFHRRELGEEISGFEWRPLEEEESTAETQRARRKD
jgi:hypothetical protein